MLKFNDLANFEIVHPELTIRRYQDSDFAGLAAIFEREFFRWFFTNYADCAEFVAEKMAEFEKGNLVMLVIVENSTQQIIGTSSLYEISLRHKRLELGSSWLARQHQGKHYNALIKLLLIDYLIMSLGFNRLQWKTDALNEKSKQAMLKLGFIYEGTLRRHAITASGRIRDSLVFALTDLDWERVKLVIKARVADKTKLARLDK